jgi:hypothetical protein
MQSNLHRGLGLPTGLSQRLFSHHNSRTCPAQHPSRAFLHRRSSCKSLRRFCGEGDLGSSATDMEWAKSPATKPKPYSDADTAHHRCPRPRAAEVVLGNNSTITCQGKSSRSTSSSLPPTSVELDIFASDLDVDLALDQFSLPSELFATRKSSR